MSTSLAEQLQKLSPLSRANIARLSGIKVETLRQRAISDKPLKSGELMLLADTLEQLAILAKEMARNQK